jgi:CheY-like chemotaxis protein
VGTGKEALAALEREPFDCMVLDLKLPDMTGLDVIKAIKQRPAAERLPIIIYTGKELSRSEEAGLSQLAETIIVKDARSPERLLDETALFLHRVEANLPEQSRTKLRSLSESDPALAGKKVLVVDDDIRNIFAITAVLEQQSMEVVYAENGQEALQKLDEEPGVDVVLMDIMMPEMDGYEAMRRIRKQQKRERLPIIALTAKAMKGDREKCIEAGASDYVTKPVDPDQLLSLLRVWLYR